MDTTLALSFGHKIKFCLLKLDAEFDFDQRYTEVSIDFSLLTVGQEESLQKTPKLSFWEFGHFIKCIL